MENWEYMLCATKYLPLCGTLHYHIGNSLLRTVMQASEFQSIHYACQIYCFSSHSNGVYIAMAKALFPGFFIFPFYLPLSFGNLPYHLPLNHFLSFRFVTTDVERLLNSIFKTLILKPTVYYSLSTSIPSSNFELWSLKLLSLLVQLLV